MNRLPRLPQTPPNHEQLQAWWQRVVEAIEKHEKRQDELITDIADQLAQIQAAQASATAAARELARINSYTDPTNVVTAADVGTDCTITIANHTRVYPVQGLIDVPDVPITGAALTGFAFATQYFVYCDDLTLADTTPTFLTTTDAATAQVGAAAGRHFVGVVTTPADGSPPSEGDGGTPPGGGGGHPL